jgi:hypothetical protein
MSNERPVPQTKNHPTPAMKTSQDFQKISAGISLFILALGFSSIGLMSLIHQPLPGDSLAFSATSCLIGGWASISVASIFLFAAFVYWRRHSRFAAELTYVGRAQPTFPI